ncbi:MAG TPA: carboxymuconolactone decarboxylase family protein [Burkholderiaceae bacterium]|nr:carboxymuconolactone decarboxylase family protein [Burkholderiaceae bacterium]
MSEESDRPPPATPLTDEYIASGRFNPGWQTMRDFDPRFTEAYLALREVPFSHGPLPLKFKELILVAVNAATTHLYAPGVRRHIRNALDAGATGEEVLEAIQLTTVLGIHSSNLALPILAEELARPPASGVSGAAASRPDLDQDPGENGDGR